jgi:alpha-tubulin suppressor-like RCC1 family protein
VNAEQIKNISNVVKICCGPHHSLALAVDPDQSERVIPLNFKDEKQQEENPEKNEEHHENHQDNKKYVVFSWGNGWGGKLGHGNFENQFIPKMIQTKYTFKAISCGTNHSGAISAEDNIIVWGVGAYLAISKPDEDGGGGDQKKRKKKQKHAEVEPHFVRFPTIHSALQSRGKFTELCLGDKYNLALTIQCEIYQWGLFNSHF